MNRDADDGLVDGDTLVGRYRIGKRLVHRGVGVVYEARDLKLDRRVALAVLSTRDDESRARDVRAMAKLSHPNVVAVHDVGSIGIDRMFMAMDYVDGGSLRAWVTAEPRDWRGVVAVVRAAGAGLVAARGAGILHLDFDSDSVLVSMDGRGLVTNFGLATTATEERSDVLAFAKVLSDCLLAVRPSSKVPAWLQVVVARGLARRYPDLSALLVALREPMPKRYVVLPVALSLGIVALAMRTRLAHDEAPVPCAEAAFGWSGVWDAASRNAIEHAFASSSHPNHRAVFASTVDALDRKTATWSHDARASCLATRVHGTQSDEILTLRAACYGRTRDQIAALVEMLARADANAVGEALASTYALPDLALCNDVVALRSPVPLPPARRAAVEEVYRRLARAQAMRASGDGAAAASAIRAVVAAARATDYAPLWAAALLAEGRMLRTAVHPDTESVLQQALFAAEEAHDLETKLGAALEIAHYYAASGEKAKRGLLVGFVQAYFDALGRPPRLHAQMLYLAAMVDESESRLELFAKAVEADRQDGARNPIFTATLLHSYAASYGILGKFDEADVESSKVAALQARLFGPNSVELATTHINRALDFSDGERCDEALVNAERALEISKLYDQQRGLRWRAHAVMGIALRCLGRDEAALPHFETVSREADAAKDWTAEFVRVHEGSILVRLGRVREGHERALRAVTTLRAVQGDDSSDLVLARNSLAEAEQALGDLPAARATLATTLALAKTSTFRPWELARTHFAMARVLAASKAPTSEIVAALDAAEAIARRLSLERFQRELATWRAQHVQH